MRSVRSDRKTVTENLPGKSHSGKNQLFPNSSRVLLKTMVQQSDNKEKSCVIFHQEIIKETRMNLCGKDRITITFGKKKNYLQI
jgi:hypothetical protein